MRNWDRVDAEAMLRTPEHLEQIKEHLTTKYHDDMSRLYTDEINKAIDWFHAAFPKRRIRWHEGMGTFFWSIDGKILDWDTLNLRHTSGMWESYWVDAKPDRKAQLLWPLWNIFQSFADMTNVAGEYISTGDLGDIDMLAP